jgi:peptidyl-tRNA hydrolase, PTH1 family
MFLVVGLGNPGFEYEGTRHNAGFMFLTALATQLQAPAFSYKKDLFAEVTKQDNYVLIKPMTYMNESGKAVRAVFSFYKDLQLHFPQNLIVAHDDLDIPFGSYKLQQGKGPKIHNGVLSIESYLKDEGFWRLRLGIDARNGDRTVPGKNYVLQKFENTQKERFERDLQQEIIPSFLARFA